MPLFSSISTVSFLYAPRNASCLSLGIVSFSCSAKYSKIANPECRVRRNFEPSRPSDLGSMISGQLTYRGNGEQTLPYTRFDGRSGVVRIPQTIQLNWVNTGKRKTYYPPFKRGGATEVIFEVSLEAARRLACVTASANRHDQLKN